MSVIVEKKYSEENNQTEMVVSGEIDIYGSEKFREEIQALVKQYPDKDLSIDMTNLDYIDSTGLGVLIGALKVLKANQKKISLHGLKPSVYKVFSITSLTQLFELKEA